MPPPPLQPPNRTSILDPEYYRTIIYHMACQGKRPKEIHEALVNTYRNEAPSRTTVARWVNEYLCGRQDLANRTSPGRPPETMTRAKIEAARVKLRSKPNITCKQLAIELHMSRPQTKLLVERHLGLKKAGNKWVPIEEEVKSEPSIRGGRLSN